MGNRTKLTGLTHYLESNPVAKHLYSSRQLPTVVKTSEDQRKREVAESQRHNSTKTNLSLLWGQILRDGLLPNSNSVPLVLLTAVFQFQKIHPPANSKVEACASKKRRWKMFPSLVLSSLIDCFIVFPLQSE